MKKLLAVFTIGLFVMASAAFAGTVDRQITNQLLDDSPTSVYSDTVNILDYSKVAFFVEYDETEVGNSVSADVTLEVTYDGTNWLTGSFYDFTGGSTLQTTETISADGGYYFWIDPDWTIRQIRVKVAGTNTDSDDTADIDVYLIGIR